jgi:transcriptional regulator with XRE-family HTH domain
VTDPARLRFELARLRMTRDGLAAALGVDRRTVYRWLAGTTPVPRSVWLAIAGLRRRA